MNQKKAEVAISILGKVNFRTETTTKDKDHFMVIKGLIYEEAHGYAPNNIASKCLKQN